MEKTPSIIQDNFFLEDLNLTLAFQHFVNEKGTKAKFCYLALHGWLDNSESFYPLAQKLDYQHMLAIDLPGQGRSSHIPLSQNYHMVDTLRLIADLLDKIQQYFLEKYSEEIDFSRNWILMGHSLGAGLASLYASIYPKTFMALVCIEGFGPYVYPASELAQRAKNYIDQRKRFKRKSQSQVLVDLEDMTKKRMHLSNLSYENARRLCLRNLSLNTESNTYYYSTDRRLLSPSLLSMTQEQVLAFLEHLTTKTLVIIASQGLISEWELFKQRQKKVATAIYLTLEGHHHLHLESPQNIALAIEGFVHSK